MIIPNVFKGRRVFITGDTGFKGSWLATWLYLLGAEVTGYSLPPPEPDSHAEGLNLRERIRHIDGDICDRAELFRALLDSQPEFVFHLAAQALVLRSYQEPYETFQTNVIGSLNLLEAIRHLDSIHVLIYVTSDKCYRNSDGPSGHRETDPLGGVDPYSASKACAELVFSAYQSSFFSGNGRLCAASVRAGNVIGGGDWAENRIFPDCIRALQSGQPLKLRNPHAIRPWQHVLEPLGGYLLLASRLFLAKHGGFSGAWNFGPDPESHLPVANLVREVQRNWGANPLLQEEAHARPYEAPALYLNCDKARAMLNWCPTWTFEESVQHTTDWYKQYFYGADVWQLTTSQIGLFSDTLAKLRTQALASA